MNLVVQTLGVVPVQIRNLDCLQYIHFSSIFNFSIFPVMVSYPDDATDNASSENTQDKIEVDVPVADVEAADILNISQAQPLRNTETGGGNCQRDTVEESCDENAEATSSEPTVPKKRQRHGGPPGFIHMLLVNFNKSVVDHLDSASQEAVRQQKDLEDPAKFGHVKLAVVDRVLDMLLEQGDGKTVPTIQFFNNIVDVLGNKYPGMFAEDPSTVINGIKVRRFTARGTGGLNGVKGKFHCSGCKQLNVALSRQLTLYGT